MMRMIQSKSAGHAKAYFSDALSKSDYYVSDQELAGVWEGKLSDRLGLSGSTLRDAFFALCENRHPMTGEHLTPRDRENRTTGYDINFHCPKSVSILHALSGDDHILDTFRESVTETMRAIEADAKTRVRKGGKDENRETGELAWAHFVHQTARPVDGHLPDPHLHSHCFVFNATYDSQEEKVKAGQFREIKRDMPYYQAQFHKTLSDKLCAAGYQIRATDKSFEIEGVPQRVIDLFSKRTDEIGRVAKEKGITDAKELDALGSRTRSRKQKGHSMDELKVNWRDQIAALGDAEKGEGDKVIRFGVERKPPDLTAQHCVDFALEHNFERASVMPDRKLLESAFRHGLGCPEVTARNIEKAFREDTRIIHVQEKGRTLCTTREVLAEEKRMVDLAKAGQGKVKPLYTQAPELSLSGQQGQAVAHVLTTANRVSIIRGAAGAGKTTLMKEAKVQIERAGKTMIVVAPSSDASRGVLAKEGFEGAETVARLGIDQKMKESLKGQVLWVDEAGLLGTKDMVALLELAKQRDARLILGGDTRQHASVVRGDALRILNTVAGIRTAEVNKIYRQQNAEYRAAVEDLARADVHAGFAKLDKLEFIKEEDPMNPNARLVEDYIQAVKAGKETLIISPTHKQGEAVTQAVRERLREEELLGKAEKAVPRLENLSWTEAEKKDSRNYQPGQIIQFTQNAKGFGRGSRWTVGRAAGGQLIVKDANGEIRPLPVDYSIRYAVYKQSELGLSKRDKVRITNGGVDRHGKRLDNGQSFEVVSVGRSGIIQLRNPKGSATYELDASFGHIAHAHCLTSYASQGKTVDIVFISQPSGTFGATDAKQFYVSISRAKERAYLYTDDKESLLIHAVELGERQSALELVGWRKGQEKQVAQLERVENSTRTKAKQSIITPKQREDHEPDI